MRLGDVLAVSWASGGVLGGLGGVSEGVGASLEALGSILGRFETLQDALA